LKKILELGKVRGVLTFEEVNDLIPAEIVEQHKIDSIMEFLSDSDIEVENSVKSATGDGEGDDDSDDEGEFPKKKAFEEEEGTGGVRAADPVKLYLRKMGSVSLAYS